MRYCSYIHPITQKDSKNMSRIIYLFSILIALIVLAAPQGSAASTLTVQMAQPPTSVSLSTEGTTDWAHWGLTAASSFNHKGGVPQQISNYTLIGSTTVGRMTDSRVAYSWSGGTPTASATSTITGISFAGIGNGYRLTIPAQTTESVLKIYLGLWRARGKLEVRLSDGSVAPYVTYLDNSTTILDRVVTLNFSATASNVNLIVEYTVENNYGNTWGNVTLQAATLVTGAPVPTVATPTVTPSGGTYTDSVVVTLATETSGASIRYTTNGTEPTSSSTLYAAPFTLTQSGTLRAKAFLSGYNDSATAIASFTINPSGGSSTLTVQMAQPPTSVSLSTEGTTDWAHWGLTAASSFNHKGGVPQQISNYTLIGSTTVGRMTDSRVAYSWSGGTPTASATSTITGISFAGIGNGYRLTIPAQTTESVLKIYLGLWRARGKLEVRLSDGSVAPYVTYLDNSTTILDRVVTLNFSATASNVSLIVEYTVENNYGNTWGNVTLQAATLVTGAPVPTVATPTVTPSGGTYTDSVVVTLATETSGASIRYTTNGTEPTSSSTLYAAPFTLTQSGTLRAKAFLSGYNDSATAIASFTINPSGGSSTLTVQMAQPPTSVSLSTEGTTDWAHWGLTAASSFNHKGGVPQQISNYTLIGSTTVGRMTDSRVAYSWSGGTPTASATSTITGISFAGIGNGYRLTIPAQTTESVLKIYLGLWRARGKLEVRLSDGSVAPYVTYLDNSTTILDRVVTLNFSATASNVNLIVEYTVENNYGNTWGNVTLQAATLVTGAPVPTVATPTVTPSGGTYTDSVVVTLATETSGASIRYTTNGTEPTSSSTLYAAPFTLTQSGTLRAKAFLSGYNDSATAIASFTINPSGGSSTLTVQMAQPPTSVSLSTEGTTDWAHWGLTAASSFNHKGGVPQQISNYTLIGSTTVGRMTDSRVAYSWSGGTPTASATSTITGISFAGIGNGYRLTIPAQTTESVLKIYLGLWRARGKLEVRLSDGSVAPYVTYLDNSTTILDRVVTLNFSATASNVNLIVEYTVENNYGNTWGNVTLQAVSLVAGVPIAPITLPFSDGFNRLDLGDWSIFDDSSASNWQIVNNELHQLNRVESTASFDGTYHKGTYVYLTSGFGLRDYRFSTEATYLNYYGNADDIGIMFRYQDNDNYYRLTLNSRYGFTRLEKKVNGVFSTLAKNARGYQRGAKINLTVDLKGLIIQVFLDGDPIFGVSDTSLDSGTIALYCQDHSKFDNVVLEEPSSHPSIVLSQPTAYSMVTGSTLNVAAVTTNVPVGGYVEFLLDGASSVLVAQPPYIAQYNNVSQGTHNVEAILHDSTSELAVDINNGVHVLGDYYLAIGDSITNGSGDHYILDNILDDGTIISFQGYEAPLTSLLNHNASYPSIVYNEGIGGDKSYNAAYVRINSILERHPGANKALILLGTNDSNGTLPVPSGLGCSGSSCAGTFKANMQALVNTLVSRQITPFVSRIPPTFGSSQASRNLVIQEYNQVVKWEITGIQVGPDLYSFFANHSDLFADDLHPNSLGHKAMAQLWYNFLLNQSTAPFVLENLSPATYKQNLLEVGNNYYIDADYTLSNIPSELADGDMAWIMTADSDRNNTSENSLSFDVTANSTIYIGYDSRALSLPNWLADYTPAGTFIGVTDPDVSALNLYQADFAAGTVSLGGNKASGASFPAGIEAANYVVIVKKIVN